MLYSIYLLLMIAAYLLVGLFVYVIGVYTNDVNDNLLNMVVITLFFPLYIIYIVLRWFLN